MKRKWEDVKDDFDHIFDMYHDYKAKTSDCEELMDEYCALGTSVKDARDTLIELLKKN